MKASQTAAFLLAGLLCASATLARQSWSGKPSHEWNEKEIRQILEHSPWAHRVSLMLVPSLEGVKPCQGNSGPCVRDDSFHEPPTSNSAGATSGRQASTDLSVRAQRQNAQDLYSGPNTADDPNAADSVAGISVVRWASARTVRDALARWVLPSGKRMTAEELSILAPADSYVMYVDLRVALRDVGRIPQNGILTPRLARHSFLVLKPTGLRIPAAHITPAPLPEFDDRKEMAIAAYYIFFPKRKDGRDLLPERETEVRFECPLAPVPIRAGFKLSQMEREGSPDF